MNMKFLNNVISINNFQAKELSDVKVLAKLGKNFHRQVHFMEKFNDKVLRALEIVNGVNYSYLKTSEKLIVVSNIVFANDEQFAKQMLANGFDEENIYLLNNIITRIKTLQKQNPDLNIEHELVTKIITVSNKYFGCSYPNVIINKMNQLVVSKPELFKTDKKEKVLVNR